MNSIKPQKTAVDTVEITAANHNQRLDNFLIKRLDNLPRTRVYRIIRKGEVRVNSRRCKPDYKLQVGDLVRIPPLDAGPPRALKSQPPTRLVKQLEQSTLFENEHLLIVDKPAGLAVHAGSGIDYGLIDILRIIYGGSDIELAHRLDRDTSGCLLLAKHRAALLAMQRLIRENLLDKQYCAVVRGRWPNELVEIDKPLKKYHLPNGERRVRIDNSGKPAITRIKILQSSNFYSVIRVFLVTGRTHQIRVHCQSHGHEIAGDDKYGDPEFDRKMRDLGIRRLMLHAASLDLPKSDYSPEIVINAPLPPEFETLLEISVPESAGPG